MKTIDQATTGDDYTAAATINEVYNSSGGFFVVTGHDVFMQLEYGEHGTAEWTMREIHIPLGPAGGFNGLLQPGTTGVRFRNYTKGKTATIVAALSEQAEPPVMLTLGGGASAGNGLPQAVSSGQVTGTHGSATALVGSSTPCQAVTVKAMPTNSGLAYVGSSAVTTTNGYQLAADDAIAIDIADVSVLFFDVDTTGEGVSFLVVA